MTSTCDTAVTGKNVETIKLSNDKRRTIKQSFEGRGGIRRGKSAEEDRAGNSRVNGRNDPQDALETDENEKRREKDRGWREDYRKELRKRRVNNENNTTQYNVERRDGSGPRRRGRRSREQRRDNEEGEVATFGKDVNREPSSWKNGENYVSREKVHDRKERSKYKSGRRSRANNEDKVGNRRGNTEQNGINIDHLAFCSEDKGDQQNTSSKSASEPQKGVNEEDTGKRGRAGTCNNEMNSGLVSQSSAVEPKEISPSSTDSGISTDCSSKSDQIETRCDGVRSDYRIGPKNSRKGVPRKPRKDTLNTQEAAREYPPKTSNTSAAKTKPRRTLLTNNRKFSKKPSSQ